MKREKPPIKPCDCIELCNKALANDNVRLVTSFGANMDTMRFESWLTLPVEKIDIKKKTKLPTIVCTYCPICGKRLNKQDTGTEPKQPRATRRKGKDDSHTH